jgi:hypothetical protein
MGTAGGFPGMRSFGWSWVGNDKKLYLFGGNNHDQAVYNDLWSFDPAMPLNNWTWVSGNLTGNSNQILDTTGTHPFHLFFSPFNLFSFLCRYAYISQC